MWHLQIKTAEGYLVEEITSEEYAPIEEFLESYDIEQSFRDGWELTLWFED